MDNTNTTLLFSKAEWLALDQADRVDMLAALHEDGVRFDLNVDKGGLMVADKES